MLNGWNGATWRLAFGTIQLSEYCNIHFLRVCAAVWLYAIRCLFQTNTCIEIRQGHLIVTLKIAKYLISYANIRCFCWCCCRWYEIQTKLGYNAAYKRLQWWISSPFVHTCSEVIFVILIWDSLVYWCGFKFQFHLFNIYSFNLSFAKQLEPFSIFVSNNNSYLFLINSWLLLLFLAWIRNLN